MTTAPARALPHRAPETGPCARTYTCPHGCGTSRPLSCAAEATQLLETHLRVRHGGLHRAETAPTPDD
jgi:hypothetical protein